ncbi:MULTISPECIES: YaaR family protein [unclassified Treponema]|uniref:YaaR family protein n=1 Tax=unclassified Treponema TaxID=2638727 RepID=UPI0020A56528|nr:MULTISPECIES: YaaR family protein [unclassified Treponema]UTC66905.1 YaaR family protein [Treponema sp. OMZ 789]UTC69634.1 YaaR family protein [Treponema sp. OMZ 790]UTC72348.1 YaaR family protein [Treponema sp. OMZ 791]
MGNSVDTSNYVSALNTAAPLIAKDSPLQKNQTRKTDEAKSKKQKTFLDTILSTETLESEESYYEKRLEGLNPEERKKAVDDIIALLQDDVYSSGANLADNVNAETISKYKKAVKDFVRFAVKNSLDAKAVTSGGINPLKQRNYVIVKVIDEKIDKLTQELLFNQLEKLQILAKLDEIKGLLINLTT